MIGILLWNIRGVKAIALGLAISCLRFSAFSFLFFSSYLLLKFLGWLAFPFSFYAFPYNSLFFVFTAVLAKRHPCNNGLIYVSYPGFVHNSRALSKTI